MIVSFNDKQTGRLFNDEPVKRWSGPIRRTARMKLDILDAAAVLSDLRTPPGNRLEALRGDRRGQHSIRINQQWRICFRWNNNNAHDVEIVDYH
ncbi:MAG: type II toxin-antitoxin system RelE/ParE family toxin [Planctomycetota bacterium]